MNLIISQNPWTKDPNNLIRKIQKEAEITEIDNTSIDKKGIESLKNKMGMKRG